MYSELTHENVNSFIEALLLKEESFKENLKSFNERVDRAYTSWCSWCGVSETQEQVQEVHQEMQPETVSQTVSDTYVEHLSDDGLDLDAILDGMDFTIKPVSEEVDYDAYTL